MSPASLDLVVRLALDRRAEGEAQRPYRRIPAYRESGGGAQVFQLDLVTRPTDVAHVQEYAEADILLLVAGHRKERLEVADETPVAAQHIADGIAGTQARGLEAAHRAHAARVEVLEERQRLAAVAVGVARLAVQHEGEPRKALRGEEPLALGVGAGVLEVAARPAHLGA